MKELLQLFLSFARIGAFTFGGGYAMLPMLQKELVSKRNWVTDDEILDYFAIGQCTPGVIAVNTATFVGYKRAGVLGAIFATLGVVTPSIIIITVIAAFVDGFADLQIVKHAFAGIRICVCALILNAVIKLAKKSLVDILSVAVFVVVFLLALITTIPTVFIVLGAGLFGVVYTMIKNAMDKSKGGAN